MDTKQTTFQNRKSNNPNDRNRSQYKLSFIPIKIDTEKNIQTEYLKPSNYKPIIDTCNLLTKIEKQDAHTFLCSTIFNVGVIKDKSKVFNADNTRFTDFLFFDFEEDKDPNNVKSVLTFKDCVAILKSNNLNYVLKTSYNYTDVKPRLHLFVALSTPIKDNQTYSYNWEKMYEKFFSQYAIDEKCKNFNRWIFSSHSNSVAYSCEFSFNDLEVETLNIVQLEIYKTQKQLVQSKVKQPISCQNNILSLMANQIDNMYQYKFHKIDSNRIMKFRRDIADKTPNIWFPLNESKYYNELTNKIFYDKKQAHNVMFSIEDFQEAIDIKNLSTERISIQKDMADPIDSWLSGESSGKKYLITNEGLGKSSTLLSKGKYFDFIYVCHTNDRINEASEYLTHCGIPFQQIISNTNILRTFNQDKLVEEYDKLFEKRKRVSFKNFLKDKIKDPVLLSQMIGEYELNLQTLHECKTVLLISSKKLQYEIFKEDLQGNNSDKWYTDKIFIFDEFIFDEWAKWRAPQPNENLQNFETIWKKKNSYVQLVENELSFIKLLTYSHKVLILSTERLLLEATLHGNGFSEIISYNMKINRSFKTINNKFEKKILDTSVTYILSATTSVKDRNQLIQGAKDYLLENNLIDGEHTVVSDNSILANNSHASVKGKNDLANKDTLIIGTYRTEIEDNILYHNSKDFFDILEKKNDLSYVREYIKNLFLSSQVSQSIGRNSGFRNQGKRTIVILPLLKPFSNKKIKEIKLKYITPKVFILEKTNENKENKVKNLPFAS